MKEYKDDCCRHYECEHWKKEWDCFLVEKNVCSKESGKTTIHWLSTSHSRPSSSHSNGSRTWWKQYVAQYRISIYPRTCKELRTAQDEFQEW